MDTIRLPLAALALVVLAACQSAPTAPVDPRTPATHAQFDGDSASTVGGADRGGTAIGSGN